VPADTLNNLILKVPASLAPLPACAHTLPSVYSHHPRSSCAQSPQNWQTSVGLPFFKIEGTVVEWDEIRFDGAHIHTYPAAPSHIA
jgi:hypothetical protein